MLRKSEMWRNNVYNLWYFAAFRNVLLQNLFLQVMLFCRRNLFLYDLRASAWRKIEPKIVPVEKKWQIWGMPVSSSNIYHCRSFLTGMKGVHLKESKTKLALSFCSWREIDSVWLKSICSCKKSRWLSSTFQTISTNSLTQTILTTRTTNNQNNVFVLDVLKGKFSLFIIHLHYYHPSHHCDQLTVL